MLFAKSIVGGVLFTVVMWIIIASFYSWRMMALARHRGVTGLGAVAGGTAYLLRTPSVVALLAIAFGIGLYVTARYVLLPR